MARRNIPASAVLDGKPASTYLIRAMADNRVAADHSRQALAARLDASTGHAHSADSLTTTTYTHEDPVETRTDANTKLDFRFGGDDYAAADYQATLTVGTRTPAAHAAHAQAQMRAAVDAGSPSSVPLTVTYDVGEDSETRGLFRIRHTGTTDSANARVLTLLGASGAGAATSAYPSMGIAKRDHRGAYGYTGESGFIDSFVQDTVMLADGGWIGTAGFEALAFESAKLGAGSVPNAAFQTGSVAGSKIVAGQVGGVKFGAPAVSSASNIGSGATVNFDIVLTGRGAGATPCCAPVCTTGSVQSVHLQIVSITHLSGDTYRVAVKNDAPATATAVVVRGY
jgi:hypothetical protein